MEILQLTLFIIGGYVVGSIPTGFLVGLYGYGVDIRAVGSGNIGSTNAMRALGKGAAGIVLAGDVLKGFTVVTVAGFFFRDTPTMISTIIGRAAPVPFDSMVVALAALAAIIGNNYSIYLKFRGGKGMGITAGILLAMTPDICLILFIIWVTVIALTRYVSLASLIITIAYPGFMFLRYGSNTVYLVFSLAAMVIGVYRHRDNVSRLISGTELRISNRKERQ